MKDLVVMENNKAMVSSVDVAANFGKVHAKIVRDVENLHCSEDFKVANFGKYSFTNKMNRTFSGYMMTRDGFAFLCMGFTGAKAAEWKEKYIEAFNKLEQASVNGESLMDKCNRVIEQLEGDKHVASIHGKGLSQWKKQKKDHMENVSKLKSEAQMLLGFEG